MVPIIAALLWERSLSFLLAAADNLPAQQLEDKKSPVKIFETDQQKRVCFYSFVCLNRLKEKLFLLALICCLRSFSFGFLIKLLSVFQSNVALSICSRITGDRAAFQLFSHISSWAPCF